MGGGHISPFMHVALSGNGKFNPIVICDEGDGLVDLGRLLQHNIGLDAITRWVSFGIKFTRQGFENAC